jgi:hypothetical protein
MSLSTKDPATHAMAAKLARRLETSMTRAVAIALEEKLAATEAEAVVAERTARLLAGANAIAARLTSEQREIDSPSMLYDLDGLPK